MFPVKYTLSVNVMYQYTIFNEVRTSVQGDNSKMRQDSVMVLRHCTSTECHLPLYAILNNSLPHF